MSHFSSLFTTAIAASGLSQREVGERVRIDHTALSRLKDGVLSPSRINLAKIFARFQPGTMVGHELIFAHLRDEAEAAGLPAHKIELSLKDGVGDWHKTLPLSLQSDLNLIAKEAMANPDFADLVHDWAKVLRNHFSEAEAKSRR